MSERRPAIASSNAGLSVAWHTPLGAAVAHFEAWSRAAPAFVRHVGRVRAWRASDVAVAHTAAGLVVAWCEEDGVYACGIGFDGRELAAPALAAPEARTLALASRREDATLFCGDAEGIVRVPLDQRGAPRAALTRVLARGQGGAMLRAVMLGSQAGLLYAYPGDAAFGVVAGSHAVHHPLPAPLRDLAAASVASRAGFALLLEDGELRAGVVTARGKLAERPHTLGRVPDAERVGMLWVDADWLLVVQEPRHERVELWPIGTRGRRSEMAAAAGPLAVAYDAHRVTVVQAEAGERQSRLLFSRCTSSGEERQRRVEEIAPTDALERLLTRDAGRLLGAVAEVLARADYRSAAPRVDPDAGLLEARDGTGILRLEISARASEVCLRVRGALAPDEERPPPRTMLRLAQWVRARLGRTDPWLGPWSERQAAALGASLRAVDGAGDAYDMQLLLTELPGVGRLIEWLGALRREHAEHARGP
ncbi:MAG: hypothetical protein IT378_08720 [Sandaracinaceae bacterium]|nr:hypothetical protein [Sandaracinaceae bacterium]